MTYLIVGAGLLCICALWLRQRIRAGRNAARDRPADAPASVLQDKLMFIRDLCDGNLKKADALLTEKMQRDTSLTYEQAVDLVYADMLQLASDETAAILRHRERGKH